MVATRYVGVGRETTYRTGVASARWAEAGANIGFDQGIVKQEPMTERAFKMWQIGQLNIGGKIGPYKAAPCDILGDLLYGVLGAETVTNPIALVYRHLFAPADTIKSYTLHLGAGVNERKIKGGFVDALTIRLANDKPLEVEADFFSGSAETKETLETPTFTTHQQFSPQAHTTTMFIDAADLASVVYGVEFTIKNNIPKDKRALDSREMITKRIGDREVSGIIKMYFDNFDMYDKMIANPPTSFTLKGKIIHTDFVVDPQPYYLEFELRKCIILKDAAPENKPLKEPLVIEFPFQAFYDTTGAFNAEAKVTLQDSITAYGP